MLRYVLIAALAVTTMGFTTEGGEDAEPTTPVSAPCDAGDADLVVGPDGLTTNIETPANVSPYPLGIGGEPDPAGFQEAATDVYTVLVDVNPDHLAADLTVTLDWAHHGDIDLDVYEADGTLIDGSHSFNPMAGNHESVALLGRGHCTSFELHVRNYIAGPGYIELGLDIDALR